MSGASWGEARSKRRQRTSNCPTDPGASASQPWGNVLVMKANTNPGAAAGSSREKQKQAGKTRFRKLAPLFSPLTVLLKLPVHWNPWDPELF